ncbi:MAG: riboflavin synthase [Bacteroidota bacterium]|nr:riboflavin synthase [Bacteroidota bacterium]
MFTGIIEATGTVKEVITTGTNKTFWIESPISRELKTDQSIAHNGVCLTVEAVNNNLHKVTAIEETLRKTNLGQLQAGAIVNLERCMLMNGRIDGHIVQGHVDATATCTEVKTLAGSWEYTFRFDEQFAHLVIEKGSVCVNGTSLTCFNVTRNSFTVAIIPYTYHHTNIQYLEAGSTVNIEFDIIGKYMARRDELGR